MRTLNDCDHQVLDLIDRLGIKVLRYDEFYKETSLEIGAGAYFSSGFYQPIVDAIAFNPDSPKEMGGDMNELVLHEIAHWTGRSNRLNRPTIALSESSLWYLISTDARQYEEHIAQYGMYELACYLGLPNLEYYRERRDWYANEIGGDIEIAVVQKQADMIVAYIREIVEVRAA